MSILFVSTTMPGYMDAPLLRPVKDASESRDGRVRHKLPLVVFSHGLVGNRTMYSNVCGALASRGFIVCAIEHRDNSAIISYSKLLSKDIEYRREATKDDFELRRVQMVYRQRELEHSYRMLTELNDGVFQPAKAGEVGSLASDQEVRAQFQGRIDFDHALLAGHSFGGGTALQYFHSNPQDKRYLGGLILDPWVFPMLEPTKPIVKPAIVICSDAFTVWQEHFDKVRQLCQASSQVRLVTIKGSAHQSQSDIYVLFQNLSWAVPSLRRAPDPVRMLGLSNRAMLEYIRSVLMPQRDLPIEVDETILNADDSLREPEMIIHV